MPRKRTGANTSKSKVPTRFVVHGQVRQADGNPLVGGIVRAYDKDLRGEEPLGQRTTDKAGRYQISYTAGKFRRAEKKSADLIVRVYNKDGLPLASSPILFNAKREETVNLLIGGGEYRGPSEYEMLLAELTPALQGVAPADLTEDDIAFLTGETGANRPHIQFLVEAARLSQETEEHTRENKLPPEVFYGFFRQNLPTKLTPLISQHPKVLERALRASLRDNIISLKWNGKTDSILNALKQLRIERAMEPGEDGKPSLGELLLETSLPDGKRREFLQLYFDHGGHIQNFWETLKKNDDFKDHVDELQIAFLLKYPPLIRELKRQGKKSLHDLADLDEEGWTKLIKKEVGGQPIGVPPDVPGDTPDKKIENYAKSLAQTIEKTLPTAVFAKKLNLKGLPQVSDELKRDLVKFFDDNPEFELGKSFIGKHFTGDLSPQKRAVKDQLKKIQRLFKLTPRFEEIRHLAEHGFDSALSITRMGRRKFVNLHSNPPSNPDWIADRAERRVTMAEATRFRFSPEFNFPIPRGVLPELFYVEEIQEGEPNWAEFFGSTSYCECTHCRSVLSPAAYLVDLLSFLEKRDLQPRENGAALEPALDVLFGRRPDIGEIELSCENTNTPLPYVDLVNEILENAVSPQVQGSPYPQTTWTSEELSVNPEHVNSAAYDQLRDAVYPLNLPLNLWVEEARLYLDHLWVQRYVLMETFQRQGDAPSPSDLEIATEYLQLTTRDREIITDPTPAPAEARRFWGFSVGSWDAVLSALRKVPEFQHRSHLSYTQLLDLLDTTFINPDGTIEIGFHESGCNIEEATFNDSLDSNALTRMHRFLRLWRRLGWTMQEVDKAITALAPRDLSGQPLLDSTFLLRLSHVMRLRAELNVPLLNMLSWWADHVDTATYTDHTAEGQPKIPSLYDQLFLNKAVTNPVDEYFRLNEAGSDLLITGRDPNAEEVANPELRLISGHIPTILAALGIAQADLLLLTNNDIALDTLNLSASEVPDNALNLANFSHLYRIVSFSKALRLSIREFLALKAMTGVDPFLDPTGTRRFVETVNKVRSSGLSIAELDYFLRHVDQTPAGISPREEDIGLFLTELRSGLQKIAAENTFETVEVERNVDGNNLRFTVGVTPAGDRLRDKLSVLLPGDLVDRAMLLLHDVTEVHDAENFVRTHFAPFLGNTLDEAVTDLVDRPLADQEARFTYVLIPLLKYLRLIWSENLVKQKLANGLRLEVKTADQLLTQWVYVPQTNQRSISAFLDEAFVRSHLDPLTAGDFSNQFATFTLLHKIASVVSKFKLTTNQIAWLFEYGPDLGWLDLNGLPLQKRFSAAALSPGAERLMDLISATE